MEHVPFSLGCTIWFSLIFHSSVPNYQRYLFLEAPIMRSLIVSGRYCLFDRWIHWGIIEILYWMYLNYIPVTNYPNYPNSPNYIQTYSEIIYLQGQWWSPPTSVIKLLKKQTKIASLVRRIPLIFHPNSYGPMALAIYIYIYMAWYLKNISPLLLVNPSISWQHLQMLAPAVMFVGI